MSAEDLVLGGYAAFASGDMESLRKIYHPHCKINFHGDHPLGGSYLGFDELM